MDGYLGAGESLLLVAYFAVVPVVLAGGLYVPCWYSARQVGRTRLVETDPLDAAGRGTAGPPRRRRPTDGRTRGVGRARRRRTGHGDARSRAVPARPGPARRGPVLAGAVAFWPTFVSVIALPHVAVGS